ncbi:hypothetical protein ACIG0C_30250 [Kitasatospora aureofaciens]|uniref:Uncharacterized protein n=1 Tax=Kitasatospora aureofaciens TaxID=1894 RepID=A0A1E7NE86_KITAU|nr:hypothetical protein [Kitasatospora aureofaciens]ARF83237.1 hypothetical protein B6264_30320 [Kitasatospora aureofaciens]OEV39007.1 hypothetical protein HS99_0018050 [Kitasatospora aureofaciens]GGU99480.1 hypothetical protein GCM10010502_62440 [Kitasatospora aureofaciens]
MPGTDHTPNHDSQVILLERGYAPTTMNGQLVAVPLNADCGDATCVPAIVDGQATAVPVFDVSAHLEAMAARMADHRRAIDALGPAPVAAAPAVDPGLSLAVRQYVLYGSIAALAAGGAVWMLGAAVAEVAPHAGQIGDLLKWAALLVALVVLGVSGLLGKLRSVAAGTGAGASANAAGEGASATGTVLALVHRTHTTTIGKQSAGWRGSISNHNG